MSRSSSSCGHASLMAVAARVPAPQDGHECLLAPEMQKVKSEDGRQDCVDIKQRHGAEMLPGDIGKGQAEYLRHDNQSAGNGNLDVLSAPVKRTEQNGGKGDH